MKKHFNICMLNQDLWPAERIASHVYWENKMAAEYDEKMRNEPFDAEGYMADMRYNELQDVRLGV